ncbi:hypothetical protein HUT16_25505 [Kitasatospora sp. NA04385]|uniref:hypothetical protein n=1 Tax=Kitasatospora sp. NA04385 TaxID=2742135 RepID=UPI0015908FB1|nr:hypothetical protein HUT16_25505 [Kitasatospora sp. NA04385]
MSTVGVRPVPASWLAALRPGGRLVTTIRDTALVLTAWKTSDGGARGVIERDWAGFMGTRHDADYPPGPVEAFETAREADGSWARAEAARFEPPTVHQGGPRRLWSEPESIRTRLLVEGGLPLYGCDATVRPDGTVQLSRGRWEATVT